MEFYRARQCDLDYIKLNESYIHNTALIAENCKKVVGSLEYRINNIEEAEITNVSIFKSCDETVMLRGLVDEMLYWNPYIKRILFCKGSSPIKDMHLISAGFIKESSWIFNRKCNIEIFKVNIREITPEQLTVDKVKVERADSWIQKPEDVVVCCIRIEGKLVCIDGYSRLVAALNKGFSYVYVYIDAESTNLEFYKKCMSWCEEAGVFTIKDLAGRVVSPEEHQRQWIDKCQQYLREQRERNQ